MRRALDEGLTELSLAEPQAVPGSSDIVIANGFTRRTATGEIRGDAVDCIATQYDRSVTKEEKAQPLDLSPAFDPKASKQPGGPVTGVWEWRSTKPDPNGDTRAGVLTLLQTGELIEGHSIADQLVEENRDGVKAVRSVRFLQGIVEKSAVGEREPLKFVFEVQVDRTTVIRNEVELLPGGKEMRGTSRVFAAEDNERRYIVEYTWSGRRLL